MCQIRDAPKFLGIRKFVLFLLRVKVITVSPLFASLFFNTGKHVSRLCQKGGVANTWVVGDCSRRVVAEKTLLLDSSPLSRDPVRVFPAPLLLLRLFNSPQPES